MRTRFRPNRHVPEKRRLRLRHLLLALVPLSAVVLAVECLQATPPLASEAAAPAPVAEAADQPRGPRALPATVVARAAALSLVLREDELQEGVPADAFFVLESRHALSDLRIRLFDSSDRLVPADETIEFGRGTRYSLVPKDPLQPGATYTLTVEGQEGDRPSDISGEAFLPARFAFVVGEN